MNIARSLILALVITASTAFIACHPSQTSWTRQNWTPSVGNQALDFELSDLSGQSVSLSGLYGQPVVVNFWATWCGYCVYEMPFFQEVHDQWSAQGLVILAVNYKQSPALVRQFLDDNQFSFTALLDRDGKVTEEYQVRGFPTTFFIDKEGIIRVIKIGAYPSRAAIEADLRAIIPESS